MEKVDGGNMSSDRQIIKDRRWLPIPVEIVLVRRGKSDHMTGHCVEVVAFGIFDSGLAAIALPSAPGELLPS
jgi:hypothetical protein